MHLSQVLITLGQQDENLTVRQINTLVLIATLPRAQCTCGHLAKAIGISRPAISRATTALEQIGWAKRTENADDLRVPFIDITPAGRAAIAPLLALEPAAGRKAA